MDHQFQKHYSLEEARALLPQIRVWLLAMQQAQKRLAHADQKLKPQLARGCDAGGPWVHQWVRAIAELKSLVFQFGSREIQIKDLERGLIDFPTLRDGREVFLCWELSEEDIEYWHDLESGYAGREPL
jgi:hypothetical protein